VTPGPSRPVRLTLLFDIDGTLLLTGGAGQVAFERAFEECFGVAESWGGVVPDGKTDPIIFGEIARRMIGRDLSASEYEDLCERYLRYFPEALERSDRFRLMPGVTELLADLRRDEGLLLGVATGNLEAAAWHKLKRGKLDPFFSFGGFGSDAVKREELVLRAIERARRLAPSSQLKAEHFVVIGDTPLDVAAAKANGVRVIGVATGSWSAAELTASGADLALDDLSDPRPLTDYLRSL
jgi:phosphoglycolate phosphatase